MKIIWEEKFKKFTLQLIADITIEDKQFWYVECVDPKGKNVWSTPEFDDYDKCYSEFSRWVKILEYVKV